LDQILKRHTSRFHYGSQVPAVTITVFITITIENTIGTITNGQSKQTGNIGYTKHKPKTNKIKTKHHYAQTNTNNVNKT
jgi:hypothetical protein